MLSGTAVIGVQAAGNEGMAQKILVIEDEVSVLQNTLEILKLEGFRAAGADNGRTGVERAEEEHPDLIICDIMMPEMNGYEVLAEMRSHPTLSLTPFIFLTARTERRDMRRGMSLGADDYLTKPFTVDELLQSVNARLGRSADIVRHTEQRLDSLRDSFMLSLPHELRTPLTSILGFSDILITDAMTMSGDQVMKMAGYINTAGNRLLRLVENHLSFAQIEITRLDPKRLLALQNYSTERTRSIIENAAMRVADLVERVADLQISVGKATVKVLDENLKKITEELVDNAFKFSAYGTPVTVSGEAQGSVYILKVVDQGRGMKPEQIENIGAFNQFGREYHEQQGSGLGLIIARRLAELHCGSLTVESVLQQGTTVTVRLPMP